MLPATIAALRAILSGLAPAEDRPHMKRIDASPALPDDGRWLDC